MSQEFCATSIGPAHATSRLASRYTELTRLDDALRDAEWRLAAAHRLCAQDPGAQQTQAVYLEVLALRDRARRVLTELAEMWVADR
jgi:hypothetical protein